VVNKLKREELAKMIMDLSKTSWFEAIRHDDDEKALILVDEIVKAGWAPVYPDLTAFQEIEIMDCIVAGLPARVIQPANPNGNVVYKKQKVEFVDISSPHPEEATNWTRIPDFDNYEINGLGIIRSRWTKRALEVSEYGGQEYVDMHDKDGFSHDVNVGFIKEQVFGI